MAGRWMDGADRRNGDHSDGPILPHQPKKGEQEDNKNTKTDRFPLFFDPEWTDILLLSSFHANGSPFKWIQLREWIQEKTSSSLNEESESPSRHHKSSQFHSSLEIRVSHSFWHSVKKQTIPSYSLNSSSYFLSSCCCESLSSHVLQLNPQKGIPEWKEELDIEKRGRWIRRRRSGYQAIKRSATLQTSI